MAEETTSRLGFEAQDAISTLERLQKEFQEYSSSIDRVTASTVDFNTQQGKIDTVLKLTGSSAKLAVVELKKLIATEKQAVTTSAQLAASQQRQAQQQQIATQARGTFFGDIARPETLGQIVKIDKALDLFQSSIVKTGASGAQVNAVLTNLTGSFSGAQRQIRDAAVEVLRSAGAFDNVRTDKSQQALQRFGVTSKQASDVVSKAARGIEVTWLSVLRIFSLQIIGGIFSNITSGIRQITSDAIQLQNQFAEITTIGTGINSTLSGISAQVFEISDAFAQPVEIVSEGLYDTLSNQIDGAAEAFEFMNVSARFAAAAVTTQEAAVNLLSSALNTFELSVSESEIVAAQFFRLIDVGRVRAEELADSFGRLELAAQLGVQFDELLAAIGTLTLSGIKYNEAFTLINNTTLKLARPSENLAKTFKELGVASAEAGIQAFGFVGFLEKIREAAGSSATELGEQFQRIRAIRGVLGLTGENAEQFAKSLGEIQDIDLSDFDEAVNRVLLTDAKQIEKNLNQIRNAFLQVAQDALPLFSQLSSAINALVPNTKILGAAVGGLGVAGVAGLTALALSTKTVQNAFGSLSTTIAGTGRALGLLSLGIPVATTLGTAIGAAINDILDNASEVSEGVRKAFEEQTQAARKTSEARLRSIRETNKNILISLQQNAIETLKIFNQDADNAINAQKRVSIELDAIISDRVDRLNNLQQELTNAAEAAGSQVERSQARVLDLRLQREDLLFDRQIKGFTAAQKSAAEQQRAQQTANSAARELVRQGQTQEGIEQSISDFDRAGQIAEAAKQAAVQSGSQSAINQAEQLQLSIIDQQIRAEGKLVALKLQEKIQLEEAARLQAQTVRDVQSQLQIVDEARKAFTEALSGGSQQDRDSASKAFEDSVKGLQEVQLDPKVLGAGLSVQLNEAIREAGKGFQDLVTLREIDLSAGIRINAQDVQQQLEQAFNSLPESVKTLVIKAEIDTSDIGAIQGFIATDLTKQIRELEVSASLLPTSINEVDKNFAAVAVQATLLRKELQDTKFSDETRETALALARQFTAANVQARNGVSITEEQTDALKEQFNTLRTLLQEQGGRDVADNFNQLQTDAVAFIGTLNNLTESIESTTAVAKFREEFSQIPPVINEAITLIGTETQAASGLVNLIKEQLAAEKEINRVRSARANTSTGTGFASGGVVTGGTPGRDSVLASLTPNEFVVNARDSRRFRPELVAMNAGVRPSTLSGSTVENNTTVGDIIINTSADKLTVRDFAKQLNRELRRKSLRRF